MTTRTLTIKTDGDKTLTGYLSLPPSGRGPGLLLLQEVYGTNADIKGLADLYASRGYVVLAPDVFFWRRASDTVFAYADRAIAVQALADIGGGDQVADDIPSAWSALKDLPEVEGPIGILGFGFGAILGFAGTVGGALDPDFGVAYFPARLALDRADGVSQPWIFHFPENDAVAEERLFAKTVNALKDREDAEIHFYPEIGHGFAIPGRPEFDGIEAVRAHNRSFAFLDRVAPVAAREALAA
ncbi:dienelactone hydrolase family protein [Sphingomonas sp. AOB5]|uniref:dienelactone hydrolase family protein n=1 Tax=Sphingomonas sp. AOB5 TaxID=3034017 RepID=UPI0023F7A75C|nr:dienelactone hydrolase family protein [Sphingomonas sp. AOB5]MDF7774877.1 dienelactone hydrolase family protein [Sphingomonas sp. AOB5]